MTAIPSSDKSVWFCEAGSICLRNPDGSTQPAVPLFLAVNAAEVTSTGMAQSEAELCEDIGRCLAQKFGEYVRGIRAIQRHQVKGERT